MQKNSCILFIPSNRKTIEVTSEDGSKRYFSGTEEDALRISNLMAPLVGGEYYTFIKGSITKEATKLVFDAKDVVDIDSQLRILIGDRIESILIEWN